MPTAPPAGRLVDQRDPTSGVREQGGQARPAVPGADHGHVDIDLDATVGPGIDLASHVHRCGPITIDDHQVPHAPTRRATGDWRRVGGRRPGRRADRAPKQPDTPAETDRPRTPGRRMADTPSGP
jgi:hypothetical protein